MATGVSISRMHPPLLTYDEHVAAARREIGAMLVALRAGAMDAPVPTCPDWTVHDLTRHTGEFMGFWTHVLCEATSTTKTPFPDAPDLEDGVAAMTGWFDDLAGHLLARLEATPPTTEVWTWVEDDKTAAFTARRVANELAVHRFDAQSARGALAPIDADLAADGIEEIFVMTANWAQPEGAARAGESIHLHGTDEGRHDEWLVTMGADGLVITREHAKGDLAIRAGVSDLELLLYQRPTLGPVERFGDDSVLDAWYRTFRFG